MATTTGSVEVQAGPPSELMPPPARLAVAFFATWMLIGLFFDGWAHNHDKPETFFSPWHGVLYSGFVAALLFFAVDGRRHGGLTSTVDRLTTVGLLVFVGGATGDFVWHAIFGIEQDIEALLSPTHLALMIGGLLMVGGPVRAAWRDDGDRPGRAAFLPTIVCVTLAAALVSFFLMYLSAFRVWALGGDEFFRIWVIASVLVTNAVLVGALVFVLRRWTPPFGTFAVLFGVVAAAMTGLDAFDHVQLAVPAVAAGLAADVVVAALGRGTRAVRIAAAVAPLVLWTGWFGVHALTGGVPWAAELWTGTVTFTVVSGAGLSLLVRGPGEVVSPG